MGQDRELHTEEEVSREDTDTDSRSSTASKTPSTLHTLSRHLHCFSLSQRAFPFPHCSLSLFTRCHSLSLHWRERNRARQLQGWTRREVGGGRQSGRQETEGGTEVERSTGRPRGKALTSLLFPPMREERGRGEVGWVEGKGTRLGGRGPVRGGRREPA